MRNEELIAIPDFQTIIAHELRFFPGDDIRAAFSSVRTTPRRVVERWAYGNELHNCWVVASDSREQIVYCQTGFGPAFPWSCQKLGETLLGMDGEWCAYLYEAFAPSNLWTGPIPGDFMLMGPGEREIPDRS
jgi:hypothetical protein